MAARLGLGGGENGAAAGVDSDDAITRGGGIDEALDAVGVGAEVGVGEDPAMEREVGEGVGDLVGGGVRW